MKQLILLTKLKIDATSPAILSRLQIRGALLYGPPGTGKTHLSRAIAKSMGCSVLALDGAALQSCWYGATEKYIRAAFAIARKNSPCVIFMDEVDGLFYRRGPCDKKFDRAPLVQFLQEMDGLTANPANAPFLLVATNRPMDLDTAFLRRLPQKIYFELPDQTAREQILRVLLHEDDLQEDVDLRRLSGMTERYSGSDLKNLCSEAALLWLMEQSSDDDVAGADMDSHDDNMEAPEGTSTEEEEEARIVQRISQLKLSNRHFTKALEKIRPTVSKEMIKELQGFAKAFNPKGSD